MRNKRKIKLAVMGIFALAIVFITAGLSYAFFTYTRTGTTKTEIIAGDLEFSYIEGDIVTLANSYPVRDSVGAADTAGEYTFKVGLRSSSDKYNVNYDVYLIDNNNDSSKSYFKNNQIKYAILKNGEYVGGTSATAGIKLSEVSGFDETATTGLGPILEGQEISQGKVDNYKLRIWISDDVNYSNTINGQDEPTSTGKYNGYTYSLKVRINGTKLVANNIAVGGNTNIALPAGLYDEADNLLCSWEDCGLDVETDYDTSTFISSSASGYMTLQRYPTAVKVVIPESVTKIGEYAFVACSNLTSVIIGNNVTSIGDYAFYYCNTLTNVTIGNNVTSIGEQAFSLTPLTSIEIPDSVTSIGEQAFSYCSNLTSVKIGAGVTSIGEQAFYKCWSLTSIEIPDSVTSIGDDAFYDCSSLTSATIGNSVTSIGLNVFAGCNELTSIVVDSNNLKYDSRNSSNAIIETSTNKLVEGCKNTNIPDDVTSIGWGAFYRRAGLTSIEIPDSVTSIERHAFSACADLTNIKMSGRITSIGDFAFSGSPKLASIEIPEGVTSIGWSTFGACKSLISVKLPNSLTSIGEEAFDGCTMLASIEIPSKVTSIGKNAFYGCQSLSQATFINTAGWSAGSTTLSSSDLANKSTAATYLKSTYKSNVWTRN